MTLRTGSRVANQRAHHDRLLRRLDWRPGVRPTGRPLDAIIVPASRRAHHLRAVVDLAAQYGTTLVVLASHRCDIDEVAELVASRPGSGRTVLVEVPLENDHEPLRLTTSAPDFRALSGDRTSNLSVKRNIGLLLARHRGWQKIMFLDDDIIGITQEQLTRVAHHLDGNRFAGLKTLWFPDNSVVCHANRLIGRQQGIFVSGAALGVNTGGGHALDVFPDVYNEDWFAFASEAQTTGVAHVGDVGQIEFNPFEKSKRAAFEEFGDLLAEGLYSLFTDVGGLHRATPDFWDAFIEQRHGLIQEIRRNLEDNETHEAVQAAKSLQEAIEQLETIRAHDCMLFLDAWKDDRHRFGRASQDAAGGHHDYARAFAELGLERWQEARFGMAKMPELAPVTSGAGRR